MTSPPHSAGAWPLLAWLLVAVVVLAITAGVLGGVLSPSLAIDLASLWPGGAMALLLTGALWPFVRRRHRAGAVGPMLLFTVLVLGAALHLSAWPPLPSSSLELTGPPSQGLVELTLALDGRLDVAPGAPSTFHVGFLRKGGELGVPAASRLAENGRLRVLVAERDGGRWFRFLGWRLELGAAPVWHLRLSGLPLDADLSGLSIGSLEAGGSGSIRLPAGSAQVPVLASGDLLISLPGDVEAAVIGDASVPPGWVRTDGGWRSPSEGEGYLITVAEGATLRIVSP